MIKLQYTRAFRLLRARRHTAALLVIIALCFTAVVLFVQESAVSEGQFQDWTLTSVKVPENNRKLRYFKTVAGQETFLYSAIANDREPMPGEINIIITAFDATGTDSLRCCVQLENNKLYTTTANVFYKFYLEDYFPTLLEFFKNAPTKVKQYSCVVPEFGFEVSHVMLTSSSCPRAEEEYLPVIFPKRIPNSLAVCAKVAFGQSLDPNKLMEWFEVQRLLGVDRIQLMDFNNPENIQKVFRYYTDMGLLDLLPYELPGPPYNRPISVPDQVSHDKSFPILDCRQRLAGYTYILGHDLDEVLMPAKHQDLKTFFKEQFQLYPDAAGFYFWTEFFLYNWGPQNNDSDISVLRYLNSTEPRWECKKYVYLTNRVFQAKTHSFTPRAGYNIYNIPKETAILHHYRICPHVWDTCNPPRITDPSILRFKDVLRERLKLAREATGIKPK